MIPNQKCKNSWNLFLPNPTAGIDDVIVGTVRLIFRSFLLNARIISLAVKIKLLISSIAHC
jgi:hypothetical protein